MPRQQAEVVAKGLTTMFVHNFDALATKDYLDSRFSEFETRVAANMDKRFAIVDKQFTELRGEISGICTEMAGLRGEMLGEIGGIRTVMTGLRGEMLGEIGEVRGEMRSAIGDMRGNIGGVRGEIGELRGEIGEIRGTLKLQSWISAVLVAGIFIPILQKLVV